MLLVKRRIWKYPHLCRTQGFAHRKRVRSCSLRELLMRETTLQIFSTD
ncbi:hypothetical protein NECAME_03874 [Necator americanus]|uniref:Uncharacterized protein n=1 Tax=Necator americanus TaxID=51031 RepID=W2T069_NECAM|nr:hypothetical protein NECAME_03874 [Necator americanus]ETN74959.1 hypothetical protein NECAME_03874 [Necator americanus]